MLSVYARNMTMTHKTRIYLSDYLFCTQTKVLKSGMGYPVLKLIETLFTVTCKKPLLRHANARYMYIKDVSRTAFLRLYQY